MTRDLYDERPYTEHAYAETHPARVAAVARLARWDPPPVARARILEIGCGRGGNLLPMAAGLPGATLVGVDSSARQIEAARRLAREAQLANVTFEHASFDATAIAQGSFDYVIAHGVLSWIPPVARAQLLGVVARALRDRGVACVSFNALPGWYDHLAARDWLRFAASSLARPIEEAGASLAWLGAQLSPEHAGTRRELEAVATRLRETGADYAFHEYLAPEHHPMLVGDFLREARDVGLDYMGDAVPATVALELLPEPAREQARALDPIAAQQLVDFVRHTSFRRALLVRADAAIAARWKPLATLAPEALSGLRVASRLRARGASAPAAVQESFADGDSVVQVSHPAARRALHQLAKAAPRSISFGEIADLALPADAAAPTRRELASELFDLVIATGALDLYDHEIVVRSDAPARPVACPVARWHAEHGGIVTSRLHHEVLVPDAIVRWVLARLDGTRTLRDLAREARSLDASAALTDAEIAGLVNASADRLVACGLVVGDGAPD